MTWRPVGPVIWEFELRHGVRFHDGAPFTAEDVVFSIERARAEPSAYADYLADISDVRSVDAQTVRITTRAPDALLPDRLRKLFIMSKAWAEEHSVTHASDYDAGEQTHATRYANGTGPFILEAFEPGGRIVLRRNGEWWGYGQYPVNIDRIEFTAIAAPEQRLAALLNGEIHLLISPPFEALDRVRHTPGLKIEQMTSLLTIFLGLDQASPELRLADIKGRNPFKDERVRQAMYQAIDIETIRKDIMQGLSAPAGMIIPPGVNGYAPELDRRLPHDPEAAKELLAQADYPNGFGVTLDCPNNRFINDEEICRTVAAQLGKIGIAVSVNAQPQDRHFQKVDSHNSDFYMAASTAETLDSLEVFRNFFASEGVWNGAGYVNPRVDALIEELGTASLTMPAMPSSKRSGKSCSTTSCTCRCIMR